MPQMDAKRALEKEFPGLSPLDRTVFLQNWISFKNASVLVEYILDELNAREYNACTASGFVEASIGGWRVFQNVNGFKL